MAASGEIQGFLMPYLGQRDSALPVRPADLISRDQVIDYPTNFNPMSKRNFEKLSKRGEQLTRCLVDTYAPELISDDERVENPRGPQYRPRRLGRSDKPDPV